MDPNRHEEASSEVSEPRIRLDGLQALENHFQLEAYVKAAAKFGKGLSRIFSKRTPNKAGQNGLAFTVEDLLNFSNEPIPTSLLKLNGDHISRAVKMFSGILRYTGDSGERIDLAGQVEIAQKLLHQGLKRPELKDELYMQLMKQTRCNPSPHSRACAWELFHLVAATMPPSKDFIGLVSEYIHAVVYDEAEVTEVRNQASSTWHALKRSAKAGPRRTLPSTEEIEALAANRRLTTIVFFLDETFEELAYDVTTTVLEAVEQLAGVIKLQNYNTFTLFECRKAVGKLAQQQSLGGTPEPMVDEHLLLDDNKYIADVLCEFRNSKLAKEGWSSRLLFKKRMFRESDETVTEPQFINLTYVQTQHDYLQGNYPVAKEDAAHVCALQMQAEHANTLADDEDAILVCIEKYITKQVLMMRPREEWQREVTLRYRQLLQFSKEDARLQFLRFLRSLPYGNAVFFPVKRIEDPIGLLPAKLILGINKCGVHFFRPVPKDYLHSAELRDIMQFGSSSTAVFFKMRVAGVLHIFQFETRQGEDICMALQTHINDIMMKRYSKAKAMSQATDGSKQPDVSESGTGTMGPGALAGQGTFGPKYEQHLAALQKSLDEVQARADRLEKQLKEITYQKEQLQAEYNDNTEALKQEEEAKGKLQGDLASARKELETAQSELALARTAAATATAAAAATGASGVSSAADTVRISELEGAVEARARELAEVHEKIATLDKRMGQLTKEKDLIEKKMQRLEKAKETETAELRTKLEEVQGEVKAQLSEKETKISEIMDELAGVNVLYTEAKDQLEQIKSDEQELAELREMKADVERKDKQQAEIIQNQSKRLEELEKLFRDEKVARKRAVNAMEDMKGKIRVYCRVRPLTAFEQGQVYAVNVPDELTVSYPGPGGAEPVECSFDQVFHPGCSQNEVYEDVRHMVQHALDGFNVCVMAFGPTGSGKSHTMFGSDKEQGLVQRGLNDLFKIIQRDSGKFSFSVFFYMLELHQDSLVDLLSKGSAKLDIKKDPKGIVVVTGATLVQVSSAKDLQAALDAGQQRRKAVGRDASRSHLLATAVVETTNLQTQNATRGKLCFAELAGSEQQGAGDPSLVALDKVVGALTTDQQVCIPYRSHWLTMLLSDALGGNAKALMYVTVAPTLACLAETKSSLAYAARVRSIKNEATKNESNKDVQRLKKQVDYWKEQAGLPTDVRDLVDLVEIQDRRQGDETSE